MGERRRLEALMALRGPSGGPLLARQTFKASESVSVSDTY